MENDSKFLFSHKGSETRSDLHQTTLRLNIQGFILFDHSDSFASAQEDIQAWVGGGKLQVIKDIYQCKFEEVPEALAKLFKGDNVGSLVTELIE